MKDASKDVGEAQLRMALRGLRQDAAPANDLWPGIAASLEATPQQTGRAAAASPRAGLALWATAASLLLVVGMGWHFRQSAPTAMPAASVVHAAASPRPPTLVQREADGLTLQYRAALREIDVKQVPVSWRPGLDALDRSALEIRGALQDDPNSRLLLQRLRDTYTRRLALARRALYV